MGKLTRGRCQAGLVVGIAGAFVVGVVTSVPAQFLAEQNAAMSVNDTLNGASVGPSQYMNTPGTMLPGAGGAPPGGAFTMGVFGAPIPGQGAPLAAPAAPPVKQILVLTGVKVTCHVTNQLLEDIHYEYRPESEKGQFYDDGTHGDLVPNDNIYTNYTENNLVLSPEANRLKLIYMRMLQICEETNPLDFFRIPVATEEPLTPLPRMSDQENDRDKTFLEEWHKRFLELYRIDSENPKSDFFPIFVPNPPRRSETPAPPDDQFNANAFVLDNFIQQMIDQATGVTAGPNQGGYQDNYNPRRAPARGGARGSSAADYTDRWGQLRRDASNLSATYGTYQGSSYFRR